MLHLLHCRIVLFLKPVPENNIFYFIISHLALFRAWKTGNVNLSYKILMPLCALYCLRSLHWIKAWESHVGIFQSIIKANWFSDYRPLPLEAQNKLVCLLETIILIFFIFRCKQILQICHGKEKKFSKILLKEKMIPKVLHIQGVP